MAMNAIDGKLVPLLTQILESQPVDYEREISHELKYEIQNPAIQMNEAKEAAKIKLAAKFNVGKDSMSTTGFRLVYWPIWVVFVTLPKGGIQKIQIEAVSGYPIGDIERVPEREKTWIEVTEETMDSLKKPEGWINLTKTAVAMTSSGLKAGSEKTGGAGNLIQWFTQTKSGRYSLLLIAILIAIFFLLK